jgi:hypothetical protein
MAQLDLVIPLGSALVFGSVIGAERQWRQHSAGMPRSRTDDIADDCPLLTLIPYNISD